MTKHKRLLLACDSAEAVDQYKTWLGDLDCGIQLAEDAASTVQLNEQLDPNLVIIDALFGDRNKFELCRQLKDKSNGIQRTIVIVTGLNELDDVEHAVDSGADDYMSTPLNKHEFLKRIENLMALDAVRRAS